MTTYLTKHLFFPSSELCHSFVVTCTILLCSVLFLKIPRHTGTAATEVPLAVLSAALQPVVTYLGFRVFTYLLQRLTKF